MSKADCVALEGIVKERQKGGKFLVEVNMNGTPHYVTCTLSGKMNINMIRVVPGDSVDIEISTYDLSKGRIVFRTK